MTTIEDVMHIARCAYGLSAIRTDAELRTAIEQYAAKRVAEATAETRLRKLLNTPDLHDAAQTQALQDVIAERRRQIEVEGWTPEHDDTHGNNSMSVASACYALASMAPALAVNTVDVAKSLWPWTGWASAWFKPKSKRENLVRAAALLLADIERLDRAGEQQNG